MFGTAYQFFKSEPLHFLRGGRNKEARRRHYARQLSKAERWVEPLGLVFEWIIANDYSLTCKVYADPPCRCETEHIYQQRHGKKPTILAERYDIPDRSSDVCWRLYDSRTIKAELALKAIKAMELEFIE